MSDQCPSCGSKAVVDLCLTCHWSGPGRATVADSDFVLVRRSDLMDLDDAADRLSPSILLSESVLRLRAALAADQTEQRTRGHVIDFTIDEDGYVRAVGHCLEPSNAWCRMRCPQDCETWTEDHDTETDHQLVPGDCGAVEWLEASDVGEGVLGAPFRWTTPAQIRWGNDDECYQWAPLGTWPERSIIERSTSGVRGD